MPQVKQDSELIRAQILDSARERFTQYGFGKTTMAEIASDCGMSAANLYRYFENKHDIGAAMACQCLNDKAAALQQVVRDEKSSASDKIRAFLLTNLRYTHERWSSQQHMNELVDAVTERRTDLVEQHLGQMRALLREVVDQGLLDGEFEVRDAGDAAEAVLAAMFLFDYPNMMGLYPLDVFEQRAVQVAELILNGLRKCESSS